jgi:hypothetical protein
MRYLKNRWYTSRPTMVQYGRRSCPVLCFRRSRKQMNLSRTRRGWMGKTRNHSRTRRPADLRSTWGLAIEKAPTEQESNLTYEYGRFRWRVSVRLLLWVGHWIHDKGHLSSELAYKLPLGKQIDSFTDDIDSMSKDFDYYRKETLSCQSKL